MNSFYTDVYNKSYSRHGDSLLAKKVAVKALKELGPVQVLQFSMEESDVQIISNSADQVELDIKLANTNPRRTDGKWFSEESLHKLAEQINAYGSTFPDTDHAALNLAKEIHGNNFEALANSVRQQKGVFKTIKAAVRDGALWVRAVLDKKYHELAMKYKKVSIETIGRVNRFTKQITEPVYLGLTFTHTPELDGVGVAI